MARLIKKKKEVKEKVKKPVIEDYIERNDIIDIEDDFGEENVCCKNPVVAEE